MRSRIESQKLTATVNPTRQSRNLLRQQPPGRPGRGRGGGRGGRRGRPKRKTADELDAEMVDYFDAPAPTNGVVNDAATDGAAQPAATEEVMDEISVSYLASIPFLMTNLYTQ